MVNLTKFRGLNIFFIGIGGISMSALACFSEKFGAKVAGSDANNNHIIKKLQEQGIKVSIGHNENNITENIDIVVYTGAVHNDNTELIKANKLGIKIIERSEYLSLIMDLFLNSVVVAGTHGKTTTTAMLGDIFINADLHPSIHIGGESLNFGNFRLGNLDLFLTEGCEYRNSIRYLSPITSVITSIELDHTDYYDNKEDIEGVFLNLANNTKENVLVFENIDFSEKISAKNNVINVGFGENYHICGRNIKKLSSGCYSFDVYYNATYVGRFQSNAEGYHNAKNSLCSIATALVMEIPIPIIYSSIRNFKGVKRRFEKVGNINNVPIICDYAHHPTEIMSSIATAKDIYKDVTVVFQPHTYSRTIGLKNEFLSAFKDAKDLVIFKTYPAREKYLVGGSAKELFNELNHPKKTYCDTKKSLKEYLYTQFLNNCVLVLGAGDIYDIVKNMI